MERRMSAIGDQEKERKERKKARRSDKKARLGKRIEGDEGEEEEEEEAGSEEWMRRGRGEEGARWERAGKVEEKLPVAS